MTTDDKSNKPPETDDDGWGAAADEVAKGEVDAGASEPAATEPEPSVVAESVDDEWSMTAPPPVGSSGSRKPVPKGEVRGAGSEVRGAKGEVRAARAGSESGRATESARGQAAGASARAQSRPAISSTPEPTPEPEAEAEPDYAAEARKWREDLNAAVGIDGAEKAQARREKKAEKSRTKAKARTGGGGRRRRFSPRATKIAIAVAVGGVFIGVIVALGWLNSRDYYFVCGVHEITAEQGNAFPPWGTSTLEGEEWKPIEIPDATECQEKKTTELDELEGWYLDALEQQANARLGSAQPENIDLAEAQLRQALLFTRKPSRRDDRKSIERLLGDVEYWRAAAQIKQAVQALEQAGKRFDEAAKKLPRHQSDSAAWGEYARGMSEELVRGPPALRPEQEQPVEPGQEPSFTGTGPDSTVVRPDAGVAEPAADRVDAAPGIALPPISDAAPASPPDAGIPRGGVLL